jgi:hypothetical protein
MISLTTQQSRKSVPIVSELERKTTIGIPAELSPEELGSSILNARDNINDEAARSGGTRDPPGGSISQRNIRQRRRRTEIKVPIP